MARFKKLYCLFVVLYGVNLIIYQLLIFAVGETTDFAPPNISTKPVPTATPLSASENQIRKCEGLYLELEDFQDAPKNLSVVGRPIISLKEREVSLKLSTCLSRYNELGGIGRNVADKDVTIIIRAHNRPLTLQRSLDSWSKVRGLENATFVISHDGYYPVVNEVVRNSNISAHVRQIYFPQSAHILRDVFPAESSMDCTRNMSQLQQNQLGCHGKAGQYNHFREQKFTCGKHHWMWTMNTVWDQLPEFQHFNGFTFMFEEDHYAAPHLLENIRTMIRLLPRICPWCIGFNASHSSWKHVQGTLKHGNGFSTQHISNMGFGFNRTIWTLIKSDICGNPDQTSYCEFDDYNWDLTMAFVGDRIGFFLSHENKAVDHMQSCTGMHYGIGCNSQGLWESPGLWESHERSLVDGFSKIGIPQYELTLKIPFRETVQIEHVGFGGWADPRDIALCRGFCNMSKE